MIEKIYSKTDPNKLLHLIHRIDKDIGDRVDLISQDNFIQCSFLSYEKGKTFRPHKHFERKRSFEKMIAQESWVVIRGKVRCIFYDSDDSLICERILEAGDASFTLYGGHNYEILEEGTLVYEYKTGPYEGVELDKIFIGNLS